MRGSRPASDVLATARRRCSGFWASIASRSEIMIMKVNRIECSEGFRVSLQCYIRVWLSRYDFDLSFFIECTRHTHAHSMEPNSTLTALRGNCLTSMSILSVRSSFREGQWPSHWDGIASNVHNAKERNMCVCVCCEIRRKIWNIRLDNDVELLGRLHQVNNRAGWIYQCRKSYQL